MDFQTFQSLMQSRGLTVDESSHAAYGNEGAFPVLVRWIGKHNLSLVVTPDTWTWKEAGKELKRALKGHGVPQYSNGNLVVSLRVKEDPEGHYTETVRAVQEVFASHGIHAPTRCPVCGDVNCDVQAAYSGGYRPVHSRCLDRVLESAKAQKAVNDSSGSYLTGIVGALLGGLIATIPTLLTIWFAERIYALLYALIPLGAYYGYKKFNGKLNKVSVAVTIVVSLLQIYIMEYALLIISLMVELESSFSDSMYLLGLYVGEMGFFQLLADLTESAGIISFVFIALGIWIAWSQITRTSASPIRDMEAVRATLTPNPVYVAPAAPEAGAEDAAAQPEVQAVPVPEEPPEAPAGAGMFRD